MIERRTHTPIPGHPPSDADLLGHTLAFSGTYVSDDGNVTVRRAGAGGFGYSGSRLLGNCTVCARAQVLPPTGEPLDDVVAAVRFVSTHSHGDVD